MNVNLKINHAMSHLPLKAAKGTAKQRLDKAISASDEFFGNVKSLYLKYGDMTPELFAKTLKHTAKNKRYPSTHRRTSRAKKQPFVI